MRPVIAEFTSPESRRAVRYLAKLVREARLARRMPQAELGARARTSRSTIDRIEKGGVETALGTWLAVMEQVGLLVVTLVALAGGIYVVGRFLL